MTINFKSRLVNSYEASSSFEKDRVLFQMAIIKDDDWDKVNGEKASSNCNAMREVATSIVEMTALFNGEYSDLFIENDETIDDHVLIQSTDSTPHIYYMVIMDCDKQFISTFKRTRKSELPRVIATLSVTNEGDHFSYEDQGSIWMNFQVLLMQVGLGGLVIKSYMQSIKEFDRFLTPHPVILTSLAAQIWSLIFDMIHLVAYQYDGSGFIVLDIFSKIIQAFSEVIMSSLLL